MIQKNNRKGSGIMKWVKRIGIWGFLFFLLKGMIWLLVGYLALK